MIRLIAAIENSRGLADDNGIPWQGKLPSDLKYFRAKTAHSDILMGYRTYQEFDKPLSDRANYVLVRSGTSLRDGFLPVTDLNGFLTSHIDVWVIGGAGIFEQSLGRADELYITQLQADFRCTKFFPEFHDQFRLADESGPLTENGITYTIQTWVR